MDSNKKFFDVGVKYILPMTVIGATLAIRKASGLGKLGVFAFATPIMFFSLMALEKHEKDSYLMNPRSFRRDSQLRS